jgi:histidine triad (HIT) family protein
MNINPGEIENLKQQVIKQIESSFPEEKKGFAIERINSMNDEEFLEFLKKNKLLSSDKDSLEESEKTSQGESPFRLIVEGKIHAYQIDENKEGIAVLEINPVSKAHIIIIPKKAVKESTKIPKSILSLAKSISKRIKTRFKPKEVLISSNNTLDEIIVNLLPVYSNESLSSPRKQASKEELEELKNILEKKPAAKKERKPRIKKIEESKIWFPRRIP